MVQNDVIDAIDEEYQSIEKKKEWNVLYQRIRTEGTYDLSCSIAKSGSNRSLNRYRDVLPYDHSRIVLNDFSTDYINASLVKVKCHQYWPVMEVLGQGMAEEFPSVSLRVEVETEVDHSHYIYRTFKLTHVPTNEQRQVLHFHYIKWPDFGVPQSPEAFYRFLQTVRHSGCLGEEVGPAIVHCSAGIGRSGTFCLVDSVLLMMSNGLCKSSSVVTDVLLEMRKDRMGLIQTADQLQFSYQAIVYGARKLRKINGVGGEDAHDETGSSEESSLVDDLPPEPPRRAESLTRSMIDSRLSAELKDEGSGTDIDDEDMDGDMDGPPIHEKLSKPLPIEPTHEIQNAFTRDSDQGNVSGIRKRTRSERESSTSAKVKTMQEKQRASERWRERKRLIARVVPVGVALLVLGLGGGSLLYRYWAS